MPDARPWPEAGSALGAWLVSMSGGARVVRARQLPGGYRNDNTMLAFDNGERYVLRRYRRGNSCAVEAALAARLVGMAPVPEPVAADPDGATAGEPVLLSRFAPGDLVSVLLPGLDAGDARQLGDAVGAALSRVGTVTFESPGFFTGGDLVPAPVDGTSLPEFMAYCLARRHPDHGISERECAALRELAERASAVLPAVEGARHLVHADFNPKNLLATRRADGWTVTGVLDWEFAFSGSPLFDVGNMLRFAADYPPGYVDGFLDGFAAGGGHLPPQWREISRALDLYALAELLTTRPGEVSSRAVALLRQRLAVG